MFRIIPFFLFLFFLNLVAWAVLLYIKMVSGSCPSSNWWCFYMEFVFLCVCEWPGWYQLTFSYFCSKISPGFHQRHFLYCMCVRMCRLGLNDTLTHTHTVDRQRENYFALFLTQSSVLHSPPPPPLPTPQVRPSQLPVCSLILMEMCSRWPGKSRPTPWSQVWQETETLLFTQTIKKKKRWGNEIRQILFLIFL